MIFLSSFKLEGFEPSWSTIVGKKERAAVNQGEGLLVAIFHHAIRMSRTTHLGATHPLVSLYAVKLIVPAMKII
jgi:hypothetical protein